MEKQRLKWSRITFNCIWVLVCLFVCFSNAEQYLWKWNRFKFEQMHRLFYCSHHPPSKGKTESEWKGKKGQQTSQGWYLITIKCHFLADRKLWHTTLKSGNLHFQESIHHLKFYAIISHTNIFNTKEHFPKIAGNDSYLKFSPFNCFHCWSYRIKF